MFCHTLVLLFVENATSLCELQMYNISYLSYNNNSYYNYIAVHFLKSALMQEKENVSIFGLIFPLKMYI